MMWKMYKSGKYQMQVDLSPKSCTVSRDCGMQFRLGGCCATTELTSGADKISDELRGFFEDTPEGTGYCTLGSGVDAVM